MKGLAVAAVMLAIFGGVLWAAVEVFGVQASMLLSAGAAFFFWVVKQSFEQQRERRRLLAVEKREQYSQFLDFMNEVFHISGSPEGAADPSPEKLREFRRWSMHLTLVGSDDVVRAWNDARFAPGERPGMENLRLWGKLWLEMRRDCGHHDTGLKISDVLGAIVNDIREHRDQIDGPDVRLP